MIIGILKEKEARVSMTADPVSRLASKGIEVWVEADAGAQAFCADNEYLAAGARIRSRPEILEKAELICAMHSPDELPKAGAAMIGMYQPLFNREAVERWEERGLTVFSLDMLPRTTRAQSMDVLSSQANIAGYKAVLLAAHLYGRYFPMFMTAAGSIKPARVLILGAGVAGLQAVATARRLGAVVEVFDSRPAVKEEVKSLGAAFIEVEGAADASKAGGYAVEQDEQYKIRQEEKIAESIRKADIVITTAQIPGKKAPLLITEPMLSSMRHGSVIVDLAAATGGNTALTRNEELVTHGPTRIAGYSNLPSAMPADASKLYGNNLLNFIQLLIDAEGKFIVPLEDELVKGTCITRSGKGVHTQFIKTPA